MNIHKNQASLRVSLGFPQWLGDSPRSSQTFHSCSHGAPVPVIRDCSYSNARPACPPRVWFSPQVDPFKYTLRLLSDTPGGSQWLTYILLMCSFSQTVQKNALVDHGGFPLRLALNWSFSTVHTPAVCYIIIWQPSTSIQQYLHPIMCCFVFMVLLLLWTNFNCASRIIFCQAAFAVSR